MSVKLQDWLIAREMFGRNNKLECKIVKDLRKYGIIEPLCENWSILKIKDLLTI